MASSGHDKTRQYVMSVDFGTTIVRCHIYDQQMSVKGVSSKKVELLRPKPGWSEMDPDMLWTQFVAVGKDAMRAAGITAQDVAGLGIATQRGTFMTWDRETGVPFHNFITWQDLRAATLTQEWNQSYKLAAFNGGSKFLFTVSRNRRYLAASIVKFRANFVSMRLLWMLLNNMEMQRRAEEGQLMFGTIETWLLWKMTGGEVFATDYSNASSTGLYDPFILEWSTALFTLLGIPMSIVPEVKDTSYHFGDSLPEVFGASIPITSLVADQQSAMFAECCYDVGDVKVTLGTSLFFNLNTGNKPHASVAGLYPVIGWKIKDEVVYLAEGCAGDTGTCVEWAQSIGLFEDVSSLAQIAQSVQDTGGVYFVPAFNGLQAPINDDYACTLMLGMTRKTTKAHMIRAILESLAFRFKLLYETALTETKLPFNLIRADGGVSNNDFVLQVMADIINQKIERPSQTDMTSLGAAYLAGLAAGVWKNKEEFKKARNVNRVFTPQGTWNVYKDIVSEWERAVRRSGHWYR
ncbi:putative glycerol kinase 5 isoform X2 [Lingula anatina]|uniref:Glycerol kinase 5 n=1 Tax=Lingula anatina TaxID=7574 RepID=A0A1S3JMF5_LINAN|nr:putative glycerol kinase 5 isoform X1 [Lingula anatina]XP_013411063.1 putative glycerol kinase 5 isoform X1 [Lingula anatina]XP_013411073.1 putative glycerol kinase 5 isoform X2 [Lingula anatina]XP_013411081.1 putative glycerol kinase 5 isoform X2 [Lingula anatina]XP_013411089.1 putative glycerol kinase 5 isoform X2 [Lingula anatina]|eukprot:XP_013411055.1 putative glycerol kinase 5 isoform X1 [Lingula anatina]